MPDMLAAALDYARRGFRVFPCLAGDKKPDGVLASEGLHNATTSEFTIRAWWGARPNANIGIATGPRSGILVVDVDAVTDGLTTLRSLEDTHGVLPPTPYLRTGRGGQHFWFSYPKVGRYGNSAKRLGAGIDIRGDGGYVVVPPSLTEGAYEWLLPPDDTTIADAPEWLLEMLREKPVERIAPQQFTAPSDKYAAKAFEDEIASVVSASEGTRNDTLNKAAFALGQLVGAGLLSEFDVDRALVNAGELAGLPTREAQATVRSGLQAGMREPRDVPQRAPIVHVNGSAPSVTEAGPPPRVALIPTKSGDDLDADVAFLPDALSDYPSSLAHTRQHGSDGLRTGYTDLDQLIGYLMPQELIVLAARPSVGKSAWSFGLARNVASTGTGVLVNSLEMSTRSLVERLVAGEAQVDAAHLKQGEVTDSEYERVVEACARLASLPIWIGDTRMLTIGQLSDRIERFSTRVGLTIVDYLQLVHAPEYREKRLQVAAVSRGLRAVAQRANLPVVALAQLSRSVDGRQDQTPLLSDLAESGAIEADADMVMFLTRDVKDHHADRHNIADLIVAKSRGGPIGTVQLQWIPQHVRFADLPPYRRREA